MTGYRMVLALVLLAAIPAQTMRAAGRYEITRDQIAAAISETGIPVSAQQVILMTDVVAASSTPKIQVQSVVRWGQERLRVRCECAQQAECLPFFVSVKWKDPLPSSTVAGGPWFGEHHPPGTNAVRSGSPATLVIDEGRTHLQFPVICLENGAAGSTIRVTSTDRRRTLTAEVMSEGLLRGRM